MSKITRSAKGKPCTIRVSQDIGCSLPDTTVLAHAPCKDDGRGFKSPDFWSAYSCFNCHQLVDRQRKFCDEFGGQRYLTATEINEAWLRGIYETHQILIEKGLIQVAA